MLASSQVTQLDYKYTHNLHKNRHICSSGRPCYRLLECKTCYKNRRRYLNRQIRYYGDVWKLKYLITATITKYKGNPRDGVELLLEIRKRIHRNVFKDMKYITFVAIGEPSDMNGFTYTPHLHCVVEKDISYKKLKKIFEKFDLSLNLKIDLIKQTFQDYVNLANYLMDQNYKKTLAYAPKFARLISGTRPLKAGRPQRIVEMLHWEVDNGLI